MNSRKLPDFGLTGQLSLFAVNGSAGDPAQVYRDRVHWSRWDSISYFHFQGLTLPSSF
jgi:hypothetical protein